MPDMQEIVALAIVALVVGVALWRSLHRRGAGSTDCSGCEKSAAKKPREIPLHFRRRR
jgi:hypothetical protein